MFAYGQNGTGKTYTIGTEAAAATVTGHLAAVTVDDTNGQKDDESTVDDENENHNNVGIIPRVINEVFSTEKTITVKVS